MTGGVVAATVFVLAVSLGWLARRARRPVRPLASRPFAPGVVLGRLSAARPRSHGRDGGEPVHLLRFRTSLDQGASVLQAFDAASVGPGRWPAGARRLVARVGSGASLQEAIDLWRREDGDPSVALLGDGLAISAATGGSQVRSVDAVIDAVRERAALQREVRALASQARTSAVVLLVMPVAFGLVVAVLDPRVREFYVSSVPGPVCVSAGLALDVVGASLMARMIQRVA